MSYRFTNTEKWSDSWFCNLTQLQMLLFIYLCDNCDIAGFIEINLKRWASDLNSTITTIEGALKGLKKGIVISSDNECVFLINFIKHQKNLPINENNKAHQGIIKRFDLYKNKYDFKNITEFMEGASKGLRSPTGIGNGNGIGKELEKTEKEITYDIEVFNLTGHKIEIDHIAPILKTDFLRFLSMRKSIKHPYKSADAIKTIYKQLRKLSDGKVDMAKLIIDQSIAGEWQGLFPLKTK